MHNKIFDRKTVKEAIIIWSKNIEPILFQHGCNQHFFASQNYQTNKKGSFSNFIGEFTLNTRKIRQEPKKRIMDLYQPGLSLGTIFCQEVLQKYVKTSISMYKKLGEESVSLWRPPVWIRLSYIHSVSRNMNKSQWTIVRNWWQDSQNLI